MADIDYLNANATLAGTHCGCHHNINLFRVDGYLRVKPYDGSAGSGYLEVHANTIIINGTIDADGSGYAGGPGGGGGSGNFYWGSWAGLTGTPASYVSTSSVNAYTGGWATGVVDNHTSDPGVINPTVTSYGAGSHHINTGTPRLNPLGGPETLDQWIQAAWNATHTDGSWYGKTHSNVGNGICAGAFGGYGQGPTGGASYIYQPSICYLDLIPSHGTFGTFITTTVPVGSYIANTTIYAAGLACVDGQRGNNAGRNINTSFDYDLSFGSGGGGGGGATGAAMESGQGCCGGGGGGGAGANGGGVVKLFAKESLIINGYIYCRGYGSAANGAAGGGFTISNGGRYPQASYPFYSATGAVGGTGGPADFAGAGGNGGNSGTLLGSGKGGAGGNAGQNDYTFTHDKSPYDGNIQHVKSGGTGGSGGGGSGGGILLHCFRNIIIGNSDYLQCKGTIRDSVSDELIYTAINGGAIKIFYGDNWTIDNKALISNRASTINFNSKDSLFSSNCASITVYPLWMERRGCSFSNIIGLTNNSSIIGGKANISQSWNAPTDRDIVKHKGIYTQLSLTETLENVGHANTLISSNYKFDPSTTIYYNVTRSYAAEVCIPNPNDLTVYYRNSPSDRALYQLDYNITGSFILCSRIGNMGGPGISSSPINIETDITFVWTQSAPTDMISYYVLYIYKIPSYSQEDQATITYIQTLSPYEFNKWLINPQNQLWISQLSSKYSPVLYTSVTLDKTARSYTTRILETGSYQVRVGAIHSVSGCEDGGTPTNGFIVAGRCPTPSATVSYNFTDGQCLLSSPSKQDSISVTISNIVDCTKIYVYLDNILQISEAFSSTSKTYSFSLPGNLGYNTTHSVYVKLENSCGGDWVATTTNTTPISFVTKYNLSLPQFTPRVESGTILQGSCISALVYPYPNSDASNFWDGNCRLYVTSNIPTVGAYRDDSGVYIETANTYKSWSSLYSPLCVLAPVDTDEGTSVTYKAWVERTSCGISNIKSTVYAIRTYDNPLCDFWAISGITMPDDYSYNYNRVATPNTTAYKDSIGKENTFISGYAPNLTVMFQESCTPEITPISSYSWDFGDYYMDTNTLSTMELSAGTEMILPGRVHPRYSRENFRTYLTNHTVAHTYVVPGYYDITLSIMGSANPWVIPTGESKQKETLYLHHYIYVEEIPPIACFKIRDNTSEFSNTIQFSGDSPLTICAIASCLSAGSFPIHRVDYDFGDGSEIVTIDNYPTMLFDPLTTVVCHDYTRHFSLELDTYTIFMSAFAEVTETMVTASLLVGPVSFNASSAVVIDSTQVRLIAGKLHDVDNKNVLIFEDQINNRIYNFIASGM